MLRSMRCREFTIYAAMQTYYFVKTIQLLPYIWEAEKKFLRVGIGIGGEGRAINFFFITF